VLGSVLRSRVEGQFDVLAQLSSSTIGAVVSSISTGSTAIGEKVALFSDLSCYFIRDAGGVRLEQSDDDTFADDLVTFRALLRTVGCSNHEHAAGGVRRWVLHGGPSRRFLSVEA